MGATPHVDMLSHTGTLTLFLKEEIGVVEKIQQSKVFIAFAEDLSLVPSAHIEPLTASLLQLQVHMTPLTSA